MATSGRRIASAALGALVLAAPGACTERDTGSIDLAASSEPSAPLPHPPPPPTPCTSDENCQGDPSHPFCDVASQHCVACLTDAHCEGGTRCAADFTCRH